jgi:hypothetical protein
LSDEQKREGKEIVLGRLYTQKKEKNRDCLIEMVEEALNTSELDYPLVLLWL